MTIKQIVDLLDPKNQNLPKISISKSWKSYELLIVPFFEGEEKFIQKHFPFLKKEKLSGKKGEGKELIHNNKRINLVGMGKQEEMDARKMRRFFGATYLKSLSLKPKAIGIFCPEEWWRDGAIGVHVAALDPGMLKPSWKKKPVPEVTFVYPKYKNDKPLKEGQVIAEGKNLMRILGTLPPNALNQKTYAEVALKLAKKWKVKCKRATQKELKKYELLNAVSLGSEFNSELLIFKLNPKKKTKKATALIGKGICYDSGGLIGKQNSMKSMKEDMAGSAAVLATICIITKNKWPVKKTTYAMLAIAQNMMGQNAMRADDIWTAGDGQTVEIAHTDAEGRLVLADAICYAKNNDKSIDEFITIATLTGSCMRAFDDLYTGMICNNEKGTRKAVSIGKEAGDYVMPGPWNLDYAENIKTPLADVSNLSANPNGGWITAGMFLHHFIPKKKSGEDAAKFCHFDIAGSIDMYEKGKPWRRKGFNSGVMTYPLAKMLTE